MPIGQHLYKLPCFYLSDPIALKLCFLLGKKKKKTKMKRQLLIPLLSDRDLPNDTNLISPAVLLSAFSSALFVTERL